eukprot:COSAG04_NODE_38_length_33641_cov_13.222527_16_plen_118_part_00
MMSPPHSLPMHPFWPECDMGGGGDGGGPAAESPVRTVAVALVTVRPSLPGVKWCGALPAAAQAAFPQTYAFVPPQLESAQLSPPRHASAQSSPAPTSWSHWAAPLLHELGSPAAQLS